MHILANVFFQDLRGKSLCFWFLWYAIRKLQDHIFGETHLYSVFFTLRSKSVWNGCKCLCQLCNAGLAWQFCFEFSDDYQFHTFKQPIARLQPAMQTKVRSGANDRFSYAWCFSDHFLSQFLFFATARSTLQLSLPFCSWLALPKFRCWVWQQQIIWNHINIICPNIIWINDFGSISSFVQT